MGLGITEEQHLLPAGRLAPHFTVVADQLSQFGRHTEIGTNDKDINLKRAPLGFQLTSSETWMHCLHLVRHLKEAEFALALADVVVVLHPH